MDESTINIVSHYIKEGKYGQELARISGIQNKYLRIIFLHLQKQFPNIQEAISLKVFYAYDKCNKHGDNLFKGNIHGQWRCSACVQEYDTKRYKERRQKVIQYSSERKRANKLKSIEGRKCEICLYDALPKLLHFHHDNPSDKSAEVSNLFSCAEDIYKQEIEKCSLLCARCHSEVELNKALNQPITYKTENKNGMSFDCKIHGLSPSFSKGAKRSECGTCKMNYAKKKRIRNKIDLAGILGSCCSLCDYDHIPVLQFHHLMREDKVANLGDMIGKNSAYTKLLQEAKKCILLCPNCHVEVEEGLHDAWISPILKQYEKTRDTTKLITP